MKPYVKGNKADAADTEVICEAMSRPNMRFVPMKLSEQQTLLAVLRARAGFVKARTGHTNQLRGLLTEFGIAIPVGLASLRQRLPILLAEADNSLSGMMCELIARLTDHFRALDQQVAELEKPIQLWHRQSKPSQRLAAIPGIGPITATALIASIGDARAFSNGRQPAASAAAFQRRQAGLARISKRGDVYLRTLLIHGARAVISHVERRCDP